MAHQYITPSEQAKRTKAGEGPATYSGPIVTTLRSLTIDFEWSGRQHSTDEEIEYGLYDVFKHQLLTLENNTNFVLLHPESRLSELIDKIGFTLADMLEIRVVPGPPDSDTKLKIFGYRIQIG